MLDDLKRVQDEELLTDAEFAGVLGISRQLWQAVRTGKKRIGESIIRGIATGLPELQGELLVYLKGER